METRADASRALTYDWMGNDAPGASAVTDPGPIRGRGFDDGCKSAAYFHRTFASDKLMGVCVSHDDDFCGSLIMLDACVSPA